MLQYHLTLKYDFKPVAGVEPALGVAPKVNLQTKSLKYEPLSLNFERTWWHYSKLKYVKYEFVELKLIKNSKTWYSNKHFVQ